MGRRGDLGPTEWKAEGNSHPKAEGAGPQRHPTGSPGKAVGTTSSLRTSARCADTQAQPLPDAPRPHKVWPSQPQPTRAHRHSAVTGPL